MLDPTLVNSDDPCVAAKALRQVYNLLASGQKESEVEYTALGVTRRVRYTQANLQALLYAMREAEAACAAQQGKPYGRYPLQGGSRRRANVPGYGGPWDWEL